MEITSVGPDKTYPNLVERFTEEEHLLSLSHNFDTLTLNVLMNKDPLSIDAKLLIILNLDSRIWIANKINLLAEDDEMLMFYAKSMGFFPPYFC